MQDQDGPPQGQAQDEKSDALALPPIQLRAGSAGRAPRPAGIGEHFALVQVNGTYYPPFEQAYDIAQGQSAFFNPLTYVSEVRPPGS